MPFGTRDDGVHGGEAEAGPAFGGFGGEERFECTFEDVGGHSGAVVSDGENDVAAC